MRLRTASQASSTEAFTDAFSGPQPTEPLGTLVLPGAYAGDMDENARFPEVEGKSLAGSHLKLPGDFDGDPTLVLVAFQRHQQSDIDTWIPLSVALTEEYPDLRSYEVPVIPRGYRLVSWFIDGGMRAGIPDPAIRSSTITVYTDKSRFLAALDLGGDDVIQILLIATDGTIRWRAAGPRDDEAEKELRTVLSNR